MGESQTKTKADQNQIDFFLNSQNLCLHKEIDVFVLNCTPNVMLFKRQFTQKGTFCHHLLTLKLFQTYMNFFLLLNTQEDILNNAWN